MRAMKIRLAAVGILLAMAGGALGADVSLAGEWGVLLDRQNDGEQRGLHTAAGWTNKEVAAVKLPGSIQEQGIGDLPSARSPWTASIGLRPGWGAQRMLDLPKYQPYQKEGDFKTPFWLTPKRVYVGAAWFQRVVNVPADYAGKRIVLTLERPHIESTVFIDGKRVGMQNVLGTAHVFDVTDALGANPAGDHTVVVRVDNRLKVPVGPDASAVTDQTQSNWNGIVGEVMLSATSKVWLEDVQVYPDVAGRKILVKVAIGNKTGQAGKGVLGISVSPGSLPMVNAGELAVLPHLMTGRPVTWNEAGGSAEFTLALDESFKAWNEFEPFMHLLQTQLLPEGAGYTPATLATNAPFHEVHTTFGLREITTQGTQLMLNGKPLYLRGTLECAIFPLTGYPPAGPEGRAYWTKIYTAMKAYGLNHLRFHSWCPPEIAFVVADEMGIYLQIEGGVWAAFGRGAGRGPARGRGATGVGVGNEEDNTGGAGGAGTGPETLDTWIVKETDAMLKAYGNHPSFLLMASANEPGSRTDAANAAFLTNLVNTWKAKDPRHLYTAGSNWPNTPNGQFQVMSRPRLNGSGQLGRPPTTNTDYRDVVGQWAMPVVSHESGQWCVYPDFEEIKKYTGSLRPGNLEIFQDFLNKAGMGHQAQDFLMASGKFQALLYKEEIECLLRTPGIGGFQLLDLHDFPGQGTAPVGVVDAFWESKPYISAEEFRAFCAPTVPLARMQKRVFTTNETFSADLVLSHFSPRQFPMGNTIWRIVDDEGNALLSDSWRNLAIEPGTLTSLATVKFPLNGLTRARKLKLEVTFDGLPEGGAAVPALFTNSWDFWVYPEQSTGAAPAGMTVTPQVDEALRAAAAGGKVILLAPPATVAGDARGSFAPIFWNRITFPDPARQHTLSILCDPKHPAFGAFPTDMHSNWQWFDLLQQNRCKPMVLGSPAGSAFPAELVPLIQFIDDWSEARKLALLVEVKVGAGSILICTIDLGTDIQNRPVARQMLASLMAYAASPAFAPKVTLTAEQVKSLFR